MDVAPRLSERDRDLLPSLPVETAVEPAEPHEPLIDNSRDDHDPPRFVIEELVGFAVLLVCLGVVISALHPNLVLTNTTAAGGDMGAHVWWPAFLRDHWFNHFRVAGWSPDWYAGFPVGQFYFPLPALLIDGLAIVMPYNIAFKLVTVSGSLLLPISAYVFGRSLKFPWPAPPLFAVAVLRFLFETRHGALEKDKDAWTIYGGNLASTLAGEFSYVLGIALGLFFLAAFARALETRRRLWLPAVLLAATTNHGKPPGATLPRACGASCGTSSRSA